MSQYLQSGGKLIFTRDAVIWESLNNAAESRTWKLEGIRRMERKNPYEVVIDPFSDDKYTFQMTGSPLSDEEYNWITNRLAQVRSSARE